MRLRKQSIDILVCACNKNVAYNRQRSYMISATGGRVTRVGCSSHVSTAMYSGGACRQITTWIPSSAKDMRSKFQKWPTALCNAVQYSWLAWCCHCYSDMTKSVKTFLNPSLLREGDHFQRKEEEKK